MTREEAAELLPIIKAYAEGKTIESRCIKGDTSLWYDDKDPNFDDDFEYRIKPEKVEDIKNIGLCPNDEGTSWDAEKKEVVELKYGGLGINIKSNKYI